MVLKNNVIPDEAGNTPLASSVFTAPTAIVNQGLEAILPGMENTNMKTGQAYIDGVHDGLTKRGLSAYDLIGLLPGGSVIEGGVKPSEGASRAETMLLGGGGGLLGTALGGIGGAALTSSITGKEPDEQLSFSVPAAAAGAIGGGALGNVMGRWLAERKPTPAAMDLDKLQDILAKMKVEQQGSNVTVNVGEAKPEGLKKKDKEISHGR